MFALIDNYDSFTYNLVQAFKIMGHPPVIFNNDDPALLKLAEEGAFGRICISSGPGRPEAAGLLPELIRRLDTAAKPVPVLGVGLGHELLAMFGGGEIYQAPVVMHGHSSLIHHNGQGIFEGLPEAFQAGRYHSLLVRPQGESRFAVTARTKLDEVMAISFLDRPWVGLQFNPESVLSPKGLDLLANFLKMSGEGRERQRVEIADVQDAPPPLPMVMETVASGHDLDQETSAHLFTRLMDGELNPSQAGALLMGLRAKGETPVEMAEAATAVLKRAVSLPPLPGPVLDVVGTGGDGRNSFNCSTATALTMAGLGYKVVKHGNRSVSSRCGSADVLELLGADLNEGPEMVPQRLAERNFAFLFAPNYHPAFRHIMPVRKELGIRTLFNILGPLVNPARPAHSFLGAHDQGAARLLAGALARMNTSFSAAVHGAGGYDELTTLGPATVYVVEGDKIREMDLDPARYGFSPARPEDLAISGPAEGVAILRDLLKGKGPAPMREMLVLNVAMAIYVYKGGPAFDACVKEARSAVEGGAGQKVLG